MNPFAHEIQETEAKALSEELKQAIIDNRQVATGRTIAAIEPRWGDGFLAVVALPDAHHIAALQYGRGPTRNAGDGTLFEKILEWVKAKGVIFQDGIRNSKYTIEERTAKTITYFIHKRGTYLHHRGETYHGEKNPILRVFNDERIEQLQSRFMVETSKRISSEVFTALKDITK